MLQEELKKHMESQGLKQKYVASKLGIAEANLSQWMHGKINFSEEREEKIREMLNKD